MEKFSSADFYNATIEIDAIKKYLQSSMTDELSKNIAVMKSSLLRSALIANIANDHIEKILGNIVLMEKILRWKIPQNYRPWN